MFLDPAGPGGTSGVGLADLEVKSRPEGDADTEDSAGPLNGPKQTVGGATTGRGISPETNARNADGDDHSRLPYSGRGTRRQQRVEAGHALESVA
ncbi:hypothetical protein NDU88_008373 [Pleurodeles waltl]|uniref:Uncharacterized protein n=1 Tax=Pleurodeles waltl TaxID=8319 RepID=A0AAV7RWP0_PLEWA|nr:hypothetical protein NDU88_008373 [Pleurodeles waltl]